MNSLSKYTCHQRHQVMSTHVQESGALVDYALVARDHTRGALRSPEQAGDRGRGDAQLVTGWRASPSRTRNAEAERGDAFASCATIARVDTFSVVLDFRRSQN